MSENSRRLSAAGCQQRGIIKAISTSGEKGAKKKNVSRADLRKDYGIVGDAHAGTSRQVSLLAQESIEKMRKKGLNVKAGDFAENITTQGLDLCGLKIGDRLKINKNVLLEITQIGKVCLSRCAIYYSAGDCIMPKEGIFANVLQGGMIKVADKVEVIGNV